MITTLPDGRVFPVYNGQVLSWSIGLYMTANEAHLDYPKARSVVNAMREHRLDCLEKERRSLVLATFGIYRRNAISALRLIDAVLRPPLPPPPY